jgi:ABC-type multidrug transport system fused ATPase/permease subunit
MPETLTQSKSRSQPTRDTPADGTFWALLKPIRARLAVVVVLDVTAALLWLVPFVAVYELAVQAMSAKPAGVWDVAAVAAASVVLRLICQAIASTVAHRADLALQLDLRSRMARHLGKVPLGWFTERNDQEVLEAARLARVDEIAARLPDGWTAGSAKAARRCPEASASGSRWPGH